SPATPRSGRGRSWCPPSRWWWRWRSTCCSRRACAERAMGETPTTFTLITGQRLLDGTGAAAHERPALLIESERVAARGPAAPVRAPDGAGVGRREYPGATILPGLVDAHTHLVAPGDGTLGDDIAKEDDDILLLQAAKNARTLLHSGVTTLRENGAKG